MTPDTAAAHCAGLVRETARPRFVAALFAPEAARRKLLALYAFDAELRTVREKAHEPMIQAMRFQWWRDALAKLPDSRSHPVLTELAALHDAAALAALVDAHEEGAGADAVTIGRAALICGGTPDAALAEATGEAIAAGDRAKLAEARALWRKAGAGVRKALPAYLPATVVDMRHPVTPLRLQWRMLWMGLRGRF